MSFLRQRLPKWWSKGSQKILILLYHRVAEAEIDPQLLSVSPANFSDHMEILHKNYQVLSLSEMVDRLHHGNLQSGSVSVTFDDGYADNLYNAKPIFDRYGVPATIFVTTGYVEKRVEYWWDELEKIFLYPRELPERLSLEKFDLSAEWDLGTAASYGKPDFEKNRNWNVTSTEVPTKRQEVYKSICKLLRPQKEGLRENILTELRLWSGVSPVARSSHRPLFPEELQQLGTGDLLEIGAHTESHPVLSALSEEEQRMEITGSKAYLQSVTGRTVRSFAYPFGSRSDYTDRTVGMVRNADFRCACSNFPQAAGSRPDVFQLPRSIVRNWDGEEFSRRLLEFANSNE